MEAVRRAAFAYRMWCHATGRTMSDDVRRRFIKRVALNIHNQTRGRRR